MEWTIEYLEEEDIVFGKTAGVIDMESIWKYSEEIVAEGRKHGSHKYLTDLRDTTGKLTILEIDDMPKKMRELGVKPESKSAVLLSPEMETQIGFSFFKDLAKINLIRIASFTDKQKAITWLNSV